MGNGRTNNHRVVFDKAFKVNNTCCAYQETVTWHKSQSERLANRGAMAGVQTLELEIQVNMTADRFFKTFKKKEGNFTDKTEAVFIHRDDRTSNTSIQIWNFIVDGKMEQIKEKIEVDEQNKSVSFLALEGDVLKQYQSYKITLDVVPKDDQVCIAKWTWEYEKLNDDVPPPTRYTAFVANYTRDLETRLLSES